MKRRPGRRLPAPISTVEMGEWLRLLRVQKPKLRKALKSKKHALKKHDYFDVGYAAAPGEVTARIALRVHFELAKGRRHKKRWLHIRNQRVRVFEHVPYREDPMENSRGHVAMVGNQKLVSGGTATHHATLGAIVLDRASKAVMALSCNHTWDEIDGSADYRELGRVTRSAVDLDAAVVRIRANRDFSFGIDGIPGGIHGMVAPRLGMLVVKTGITTKTTYGYIEGISADEFSVARLPGMRGELTQEDDSGSAWIEVESGAAVGLHWGGELPNEPECAYAHWMTRIARRLRIEVSRRTAWKGRTPVGPAIAVWKHKLVLAAPARRGGKLETQIQDDRRPRSPRTRRVGETATTAHSVAMIAWQHLLVMAWVDRRTHQIHLATSKNGGSSWSAGRSIGERTLSSPALAVAGDGVALAWRDWSTNRIRVAFTTNGRDWSASRALPFETTSGPTLETLGSSLVIAWRDAGSDAIRVAVGRDAQLHHVPVIELPFKTRARPVLRAHAGCLYLAWTSSETGRQLLASSDDGKHWSDPPLAMHDTAIDGPALASQGHDLIWAWTDSRGRVTSLRTERRPPEDG